MKEKDTFGKIQEKYNFAEFNQAALQWEPEI